MMIFCIMTKMVNYVKEVITENKSCILNIIKYIVIALILLIFNFVTIRCNNPLLVYMVNMTVEKCPFLGLESPTLPSNALKIIALALVFNQILIIALLTILLSLLKVIVKNHNKCALCLLSRKTILITTIMTIVVQVLLSLYIWFY